MRRPARLTSARAWILKWMSAGRQVRAGDYAARYGVDRYTAYQEMVMLRVPIAAGDRRYADRPPPRPRVRRRRPPRPGDETPDLFELGGRLMLVIGYTPGGIPYGPFLDELQESFDPAEIDFSGEPF